MAGASKTIGGINVAITATTQQFVKGITAAQRHIGSFQKTVKGLVFNLKTLGAALAVGTAGKMLVDQFKAVDALQELSEKTGVTTDKLAGLQIAARNAGVSNELLEKSLVKVGNAYGMRGDQALQKWIEDTSKLTTQHEKLAAATAMFGERGSDMVRFLVGGTQALKDAQKTAEFTGAAISQANATGIANMMEKWDDLKEHVVGAFRSMAAESWPFVNGLLDATMAGIKSMGGGKGVGKFVYDVLVEMAKQVVNGINNMVANVVKMAASVMHFLHDWRNSNFAKASGFGYRNDDDKADAFNSALKMGSYAMELAGNKPGDAIQKFADKAREQATAAAQKWMVANEGSPFLDAMKNFGYSQFGNFAGMARGLAGIRPTALQKMMFGGLGAAPTMAMRSTGHSALTALDPLSREGNSQRVRSLAQNGQDIAKKQLSTQQKMEGHLSKLVGQFNFAPANL